MSNIKAFLGVIFTAFMVLVTLGAYKAGKDKVKSDVKGETIEKVKDAKDARDKLNSDPEYANRVRDEFRR